MHAEGLSRTRVTCRAAQEEDRHTGKGEAPYARGMHLMWCPMATAHKGCWMCDYNGSPTYHTTKEHLV